MKYYLRAGNLPNDKKLFLECTDYYDGIVFPVNILAYYYNAIKYTLEATKKPFFIDPITAIFQKNQKQVKREVLEDNKPKSEFKKSIDLYFKYIGGTARDILKESDIKSSTFNDDNLLDKFIEDILDYQYKIFKEKDNRSLTLDAYIEFLDETDKNEEQKNEITPCFLVAPYFYFDEITDPWYLINQKIARRVKKEKYHIPIYGVICTKISVLNDDRIISQIVSDFSNYDGFLIFLSGFNEYTANEEELSTFLKFISVLGNTKKPIINLYGSYFSQLMQYFGLNGFSTGVGILERKDLFEPKSEGYGQHKKLYNPALHRLITEEESKSLIREAPQTNTYNSPYYLKIEEFIKRNVTRKYGVDYVWKHLPNINYQYLYPDFIYTKKEENREIESNNLKEIIISLKLAWKSVENNQMIRPDKKGHLNRWITVLSDNIK